MSAQEWNQIFQGCTALYLFFMSWNFTTNTFMSFLIYKFVPLALAIAITINQFIEAGYIVKV